MRAIALGDAVLKRLIAFVPEYEFDALAKDTSYGTEVPLLQSVESVSSHADRSAMSCRRSL